ncbi:uncharacterized protein LOC115626136 [Scaptodrosophila lebanonensis]|uniref:Uncharacterized protein LOC115626136 n=1 Tax=Drosophila lebanonensis TaxID=7225 RepID=A0A6J2TMH4_DROLE|nr:uncharacterized protein LOC115626136 [Scaptodrosophila lebanonensis]
MRQIKKWKIKDFRTIKKMNNVLTVVIIFMILPLGNATNSETFYEIMPSGSFHVAPYKQHGIIFSLQQASNYCQNNDGDLLKLKSNETYLDILELIYKLPNGTSFTTGEVVGPEGWSGKKELGKWLPDEPNGLGLISLVLVNDEVYMKVTNGEDSYFICENVHALERYSYFLISLFVISVIGYVVWWLKKRCQKP